MFGQRQWHTGYGTDYDTQRLTTGGDFIFRNVRCQFPP